MKKEGFEFQALKKTTLSFESKKGKIIPSLAGRRKRKKGFTGKKTVGEGDGIPLNGRPKRNPRARKGKLARLRLEMGWGGGSQEKGGGGKHVKTGTSQAPVTEEEEEKKKEKAQNLLRRKKGTGSSQKEKERSSSFQYGGRIQ